MKKKCCLVVVVGLFFSVLNAQQNFTITGVVNFEGNHKAVVKFSVALVNSTPPIEYDATVFYIREVKKGVYVIKVTAIGYVTQFIEVTIIDKELNIGVVVLEKEKQESKNFETTIVLDDAVFNDEETIPSMNLLQSNRDVFLAKAAFDFGQAFFKVRGYDSKQLSLLLNGIPMNKFFSGRAEWNNLGGLNDVLRNQEFTNGLGRSAYAFGGLLGTNNISTKASKYRKGPRVSSSLSNKSYAYRIMTTYNSGKQAKGISYSVSGSKRWAKEGFVDGTLYDAYSFFGTLEYPFSEKHSITVTGIFARNRRGRTAAVTDEVFQLVGNTYNPNWGIQDAEIRNIKEKLIEEPLVMLNYYYEGEKLKLTFGASYQFGEQKRSNLGYYNAPNPSPVYYRYLPSYYINKYNADFVGATSAKESFIDNPQVNWGQLYLANANTTRAGRAAYVLYDDVNKDKQLSINLLTNIKLATNLTLDVGASYRQMNSDNYAQIKDLLGATYHEDIDVFSGTSNNVLTDGIRKEDDKFSYNYKLNASSAAVFGQLAYERSKWKLFISGNYLITTYQREGLFDNQRFENNSFGESEELSFSDYGAKFGFSYNLGSRHYLTLNGGVRTMAPTLQNVFVNVREQNSTVPELKSEFITSADLNYILRYQKLLGRVTGYYANFTDETDINFFYFEGGVGTDFVQEVVSGISKTHYGVELGLEYEAFANVKIIAAAAIGKHVYSDNPNVSINFDTAGDENELIAAEGTLDLGKAKITDYKLANGPQKAYSLGLMYRDPSYWWLAATANLMGNSFVNISTVSRTDSFLINPETQLPFPEATTDEVNKYWKQERLQDVYLLNLVGGKSWLLNKRYISLFIGINNLFDLTYKTGGYEQSRKANFGNLQKDNTRGTPSFASKYWYGYGRTYFINLAINF